MAHFAMPIDDTFMFPYREIVYVEGAMIMLAHSKMFYNERPAPIARHVTTNIRPFKYSLTRLQNPALFQKVVMALKQLHQDASVATTEPAPSPVAPHMDGHGHGG